jgi:hypothetical protein
LALTLCLFSFCPFGLLSFLLLAHRLFPLRTFRGLPFLPLALRLFPLRALRGLSFLLLALSCRFFSRDISGFLRDLSVFTSKVGVSELTMNELLKTRLSTEEQESRIPPDAFTAPHSHRFSTPGALKGEFPQKGAYVCVVLGFLHCVLGFLRDLSVFTSKVGVSEFTMNELLKTRLPTEVQASRIPPDAFTAPHSHRFSTPGALPREFLQKGAYVCVVPGFCCHVTTPLVTS